MRGRLEEKFKAVLKENMATGGKIHLTLDAWTSGNRLPYLGITAHCVDVDCHRHCVVLDLVRLRGSHTGGNLAAALLKGLEKFDRLGHLGCITTDNASNSATMVDSLEESVPDWAAMDYWVRCMAHTMNLSAQKFITTPKADASEVESQMAMDETFEADVTTVVPANVVKKVRRVVAKIRVSHLIAEAHQRECGMVNLKFLTPILDVKTR